MFKKLCDTFEGTFVLKDIKDQAHQTIYSLSMDPFNGDFDQYATAFKLAQAHSGVELNSILVNAQQRNMAMLRRVLGEDHPHIRSSHSPQPWHRLQKGWNRNSPHSTQNTPRCLMSLKTENFLLNNPLTMPLTSRRLSF